MSAPILVGVTVKNGDKSFPRKKTYLRIYHMFFFSVKLFAPHQPSLASSLMILVSFLFPGKQIWPFASFKCIDPAVSLFFLLNWYFICSSVISMFFCISLSPACFFFLQFLYFFLLFSRARGALQHSGSHWGATTVAHRHNLIVSHGTKRNVFAIDTIDRRFCGVLAKRGHQIGAPDRSTASALAISG